jgi:hypothetical protein
MNVSLYFQFAFTKTIIKLTSHIGVQNPHRMRLIILYIWMWKKISTLLMDGG